MPNLFFLPAVLLFLFAGCSAEQIIPATPQSKLYYERGTVLSDSGDYIGAADMFKKAFELEKNARYVYSLGVVYQRIAVYEQATEAYLQTIEINENYAEAWYNLAICYDRLNYIDDAKAAYQKYTEIISAQDSDQ